MINNARLREKLKCFDVSLKSFSVTVDLATAAIMSKKVDTRFAAFMSDRYLDEVREDAEDEVKEMTWEAIEALAVEFEVGVEMASDAAREDNKFIDRKMVDFGSSK